MSSDLRLRLESALQPDKPALASAIKLALPSSHISDGVLILRYGPGTTFCKRQVDAASSLVTEALRSLDCGVNRVRTEQILG